MATLIPWLLLMALFGRLDSYYRLCSCGVCTSSRPAPVSSFVGTQVVLPCNFGFAFPSWSLLDYPVKWCSESLGMVLEQSWSRRWVNPEFKDRAEVLESRLDSLDCSLIIQDVQVTDAGQYSSYMVLDKARNMSKAWAFIQSVNLLVLAHKSVESKRPGEDLVLDLPSPRSMSLVFQDRNSSDWVPLWQRGTEAPARLQKDPLRERLTLKNLTPFDQGTYKVLDVDGNTMSSTRLTLDQYESTTMKVNSRDESTTMKVNPRAVKGMRVIVPQQVIALLEKNSTLECTVVDGGSNFTLIQSSWEHERVTVAVYNPSSGIYIHPEFRQRLHYRSPSSHDATIVLQNMSRSDRGTYTCKVNTLRQGNFKASTNVRLFMGFTSADGFDGEQEMWYVGRENAQVTCKSDAVPPPHHFEWTREDDEMPEGVEIINSTLRFLRPLKRSDSGVYKCLANYGTKILARILRIRVQAGYTSTDGFDGEQEMWYVGRENAQITCKSDAVPPLHHFRWIRLDRQMPKGVEIINSTLRFLRPLERSDSGDYNCLANYDTKILARDLRIRVRDPPTMPSTITAPTATSLRRLPPTVPP